MKRYLVFSLSLALAVSMAAPSAHARQERKTVFSESNERGTVTVTQSDDGLFRYLYSNGRLIGWTGDGTGRRALYPFMLSRPAERVLILGMGSGAEVHSALMGGAADVDAVMENGALLKAADWFSGDNKKSLDDKRFHPFTASPAGWFQKNKNKYDIIISGLTSRAGGENSPELSLEHLRDINAALKPGGLAAQWVDLSAYTKEEVLAITATFDKAFPYVTIWFGDINPARSWIMLLGSKERQSFDTSIVHERLEAARETNLMTEASNAYSFLSFYVTYDNALESIVSTAPVHRMEKPAISSPAGGASNPAGQSLENFVLWNNYRAPITNILKTSPAAAEKLKSYFRARSSMIQGRIIGTAGKTSEEISWYDKAFEAAPDDPHLSLSYFIIGRAFYRSGLLEQAAILLEKSKKITPDAPVVRFYLGKTYEKMMKFPQAEEEFNKLKELAPGYYERPAFPAHEGAAPIS